MSIRVLLWAVALVSLTTSTQPLRRGHAATCSPTTTPPGVRYGNEFLSTVLWPDGRVIFRPGGSGFSFPNGALEMKFPWWRLVKGHLRIEGHRLDNPAPPLQAHIPEGYGDLGFQATGLVFPTVGCWEVTGRIGEGHLTFVTEIVRSGGGSPR